MPEGSGEYIPPITKIEPLKPQETLKNQHFSYTVVFGQGPVQEIAGVPKTGREGLNFYSRLEAKAATQMLKWGKTDKLIITGGKTGARKETDEGKSESELMVDIIKRELGVDEEGNFYNMQGQAVKFDEVILLETESSDTLANFVKVINKYIDKDNLDTSKMALLGIGFHAYPGQKLGIGNSDISRLQALSKIFNINSPVYSAEDVLKELVVEKHEESSAIASMLTRLTDLSQTHEVTRLKAKQEDELVNMLKQSDWLRVLDQLESETRIKQILKSQPELLKEFRLTEEQLEKTEIEFLKNTAREIFKKIKPTQTKYPDVKKGVFKAFEEMGIVDAEGNKISEKELKEEKEKNELLEKEGKKPEYHVRRNILTYYGKGELPK